MLARAAVNAVRQWCYKPMIVDAEPRELDATMSGTFARSWLETVAGPRYHAGPTYAGGHLVRITIPLRAPHRPGPRIVILYAESGSGRAILMNDGLGKYQRQRVLRTQRYVYLTA